MYSTSWKSIVGFILNRFNFIWGRKAAQSGLVSFREKQNVENAFNNKYIGKKDVLLSKIVGSVGRYNDFNSQFLLKNEQKCKARNICKKI